MDSPRSGFRRSAAASWALVGLGIAGVAGTSALAYADTFKPPVTEVVAVDDPPPGPSETPGPIAPPVPLVISTTVDPPPVIPPETTVQPAPIKSYRTPDYTPRPTSAPTAAPATHESSAPSTPPTTRRRTLAPAMVMSPNFSPHTTARGS